MGNRRSRHFAALCTSLLLTAPAVAADTDSYSAAGRYTDCVVAAAERLAGAAEPASTIAEAALADDRCTLDRIMIQFGDGGGARLVDTTQQQARQAATLAVIKARTKRLPKKKM